MSLHPSRLGACPERGCRSGSSSRRFREKCPNRTRAFLGGSLRRPSPRCRTSRPGSSLNWYKAAMGMLRCSVVLALLSLALLVAPSSDARVVTLGLRELPKAKTFVACRLDCPFGFTVAQAYPAELNSAPAAGIITSWRVVGEGGEISLQVLERAAPGGWRGAGVTSPAADSEGGSNPTYLPIGPGDLIGTDLIPNEGDVGLVTPSTAEYFEWDEPPLGETAGRTPNYQTQGALELSAEVEPARSSPRFRQPRGARAGATRSPSPGNTLTPS